ncbi:MAG TPA: hypothetical protein DCS59_03770 [Eubacterium sp.]|nr:hypothetical protein [Eubacterium sp.]
MMKNQRESVMDHRPLCFLFFVYRQKNPGIPLAPARQEGWYNRMIRGIMRVYVSCGGGAFRYRRTRKEGV